MKKIIYILILILTLFMVISLFSVSLVAAQAPPIISAAMVTKGKDLYKGRCLMCHGDNGNKITTAQLDKPEWLQSKSFDGMIKSISEGKPPLMPAFNNEKGGLLSPDDIQAIAGYLWDTAILKQTVLGPQITTSETDGKSSTIKTEAVEKSFPLNLTLSLPNKWYRGGEASLSAILTADDGKPIQGENINFYLDYSFFLGLDSGKVSGMMDIGKATTDENGIARLKYTPRLGEDLKFVARYNGSGQFDAVVSPASAKIEDNGHRFYNSEVGIPMPSLVHYSLAESAPVNPAAPFKQLLTLKLPTLILGLLIAGIWFTYVRVAYGLLRISRVYTMSNIHSTRESFRQSKFLFPVVLMIFLAIFALTLLSVIFTSPDTHLNLH